MDFFEAQARARKRTGRLVVLFALAVIGTIFAGYTVAMLIFRSQIGGGAWQPGIFAAVAAGTLLVVSIGAGVKWAEYRGGGAAVAEGLGATRVDPGSADLARRRLLNVVEEMSLASGVPVPTVYILEDEPAINAFAAGLTTNDAVVTVTRGTLEKLNREELQGVIGHEFSHVLNGDMRLNMRIGALIFGILLIGLAGRGILEGLGRGRVRVSSRGKGGGQGVALILALGIGLLIIGYTGYFFGRLIQAAVSRQREFLADASSVQFTRNPSGIVNALRKIGGYALGSSIQTTKSEAIGHFFFAQAFGSAFGGLWATHPPLDERIRAIDPAFDGKYIEPAEVVDVEHEPWTRKGHPADVAGFAPGALARTAARTRLQNPQAVVASAGTLTLEQVRDAQLLLQGLPDILREAARGPDSAMALIYGLLLAETPDLRSRQLRLVAEQAGPQVEAALRRIEPVLPALRAEQRLPLAQLAQPALRSLPAATIERFLGTLDAIILSDESVSPFEFALQKTVQRALDLGRKPDATVIQIYSFNAVVGEISTVLSALARSGSVEEDVQAAFDAGAAQIKLIEGDLRLQPPESSRLPALGAALDRLATASPIIKQRMLVAAAHTVSADNVLRAPEVELLRAVAATLDVPIPA